MSIVKEGYPFIAIGLILGIVLLILPLGYFSLIFGTLLILFGAFCIYFFRDPKVSITQGKNLVLSPCNGKVLAVEENEEFKIVRVFLSVFDVHLQRSPVAGQVISVKHLNGKFLKAMDPKAHVENEQNIITIKNDKATFIVKQIAGILARRCVAWVEAGDELKAGDKIGVIKFSSQVDILFPKNIEVKIKKGERVVSGISIIGEIK
ncbi:MAG: phosphatidylserine decarboxylase [Elusimicrobiota bacterium]|jgi:phosphatidylserine decarboxylase|nr:phosphatidylserine decarboxylase [Elusimicrobiota bacterium]